MFDEPRKYTSLATVAVIVWVPGASADVVHVAWPKTSETTPQPGISEPVNESLNVTTPVGVPGPDDGPTVAVNVTTDPNAVGEPLVVSDVVLVPRTTT